MTKTDFDTKYSPIAMPQPFAGSGSKTLPANTQDDASGFSYPLGFNDAYSSPDSNNGKFVTRAQMNAIGNLATHNDFYRRCGGLNTFDPDFASAIGGYPKGAVLLLLKNSKVFYVISLVDNNKFDFISRGVDDVNWKYLNMDAPTDEPIISEGYVDKVVASINAVNSNYGDILRIGLIRSEYTGFVSIAPTCMIPGVSSSPKIIDLYEGDQEYYPFGSSLFMKNIGPSSGIQENIVLPSFSGGTWTLNGFSQMDFPFFSSKILYAWNGGNSEGVSTRLTTIDTTDLLRVNEGDYIFIAASSAVGSFTTNSGSISLITYPNSLVGNIVFRFVLG